MRRTVSALLLAGITVTAAACGGGSSSGTTAGTPPSSSSTTPSPTPSPTPSGGGKQTARLAGFLLTGSRVGRAAGHSLSVALPRGGEGLSVATLDLCDAHYPSESQRRARLQVDYVTGSTVDASEEVVTYATGGGATAYREVRTEAQHCPSRVSADGVVATRLAVLPRERGLTGDQLTVVQRQAPKKGPAVWTAAAYQYDGNLFAGMYVYASTRAAAVREVRALAPVVATKLETGGGTATAV